MRILALAHQWIPEHNAGAEVMLHSMLRALAARGHEVTVLLSRQAGAPYTLDEVQIVPQLGDGHARLIPVSDVLVTHLENTPRATLLGKWNQVPVVQVLHNTMEITRSWLVREPIALAVCNSEWMLADYKAWCDQHHHPMPPAIVCRPPVNPAEYATTPGDRVTLINLRPDERAGDGTVLGKGAELFWWLAEQMPDVQFLGVKGAYGAQMVRDLPNVEVLDHVPHDQMRDRVYARTRVLLMPSSYESWGRTAVEAMASGIPTAYHPTAGLLEAVGDAGIGMNRAGIGINRDQPRLWAEALRLLCDDRIYSGFRSAALRRSAELDPTHDLTTWCEAIESLRR